MLSSDIHRGEDERLGSKGSQIMTAGKRDFFSAVSVWLQFPQRWVTGVYFTLQATCLLLLWFICLFSMNPEGGLLTSESFIAAEAVRMLRGSSSLLMSEYLFLPLLPCRGEGGILSTASFLKMSEVIICPSGVLYSYWLLLQKSDQALTFSLLLFLH